MLDNRTEALALSSGKWMQYSPCLNAPSGTEKVYFQWLYCCSSYLIAKTIQNVRRMFPPQSNSFFRPKHQTQPKSFLAQGMIRTEVSSSGACGVQWAESAGVWSTKSEPLLHQGHDDNWAGRLQTEWFPQYNPMLETLKQVPLFSTWGLLCEEHASQP